MDQRWIGEDTPHLCMICALHPQITSCICGLTKL